VIRVDYRQVYIYYYSPKDIGSDTPVIFVEMSRRRTLRRSAPIIFDQYPGQDGYYGALHLLGWLGIGGSYKYCTALPLSHQQITTGLITDNLFNNVAHSEMVEVQPRRYWNRYTCNLCRNAPVEKVKVQRTANICSNGNPPRNHQVQRTGNI
jgi:hypothetical protein